MYSGKKSSYAIKVVMIAVIVATLTVTVVAAGPLSIEETNQPFDSNTVQEANNPEAVQQPQNNTAVESPNENVQSSSKNEVGQPAGIVISGNVGIYTDSACTQPLTSIDWGSFSPGGSVNRIIYIKNAQSIPLTLNMSTTNWTPIQAAESITVTWNKENVILPSQQSTAATLTLTVASNISGISQFSVDIIIKGL